jgi:DNA-binding transcriptional MerR regulator
MADEPLLTLKQVAEELGLPPSTLRYYRNAYSDYVAAVGAGRRRRYPPQAVAVLRHIAQSYAAGKSKTAILLSLDGTATATFAAQRAGGEPRSMEEVSNLDLLAAIVDGEREQREALWQMAREIVRLTDVLEGQERLLVEVADHAGVDVAHVIGEGAARAALQAGPPASDSVAVPTASAHTPAPAPSMDRTPPARPAPEEPLVSRSATQPAGVAGPPAESPPAVPTTPTEPPAAAPLVGGAFESEVERLKQQLETERLLVERLRDAKLKLEQRAADAEAELEERRAKRSSIIRRILGPETDK